MANRIYNKDKNVYVAAQERLEFLFANFPRIYLSFSGGKDSGVMLNLVLDYMRRNKITRKIGVMTMDNECNFQHSLKFMHSILEKNRDLLDIYWCCLPLTLPCTVSSYQIDWQCWGEHDKDKWVRPMPQKDYVVNIHNMPFTFFRQNMLDKEFYDEFAEWYAQGERCACLIGIRTVESLNRYRAIMNNRKEMLGGHIWTKKNGVHSYNCYPIYDWKTEDIWTANAKFDWEYNGLYDIFYKAGVPVHKMRVASPFMSESKSSLSMYRVIDSECWARLCARVCGANFIATYGKQLGYRSIKLPPGHTWKSFVKFLLDTLPKEVGDNFRRRFVQSLRVWGRTGRGLPEETIGELAAAGIKFRTNGKTAHGRKNKDRVTIRKFPDHLDMLSCNPGIVASWKRFAITILKNDHTCKYMGLAPTKEQAERQRAIQKKYKKLQEVKVVANHVLLDRYDSRGSVSQYRFTARIEPTIAGSGGAMSESERLGYEANGFLIMQGVFSKAAVDTMQREAESIRISKPVTSILEPNSNVVRSAFAVHRNAVFDVASRHPVLLDYAREIVGDRAYLHQSRINYKSGFRATGWMWHSDFETWHIEDGMPSMRCVSAMICLTDNTEINGPLMIVSGSHKRFLSCIGETPDGNYLQHLADQKVGVPDEASMRELIEDANGKIESLTVPRGTVVLFDCNAMHGSNSNVSPYCRTNVFFVYNSIQNRIGNPLCGKLPRPEHVATRESFNVLEDLI